jgi:histidinol-phosphatase (PHP family)
MPLIENVPYEEYAMKITEVETYISTLEILRKKYADQIGIRIAFEVDFFDGQEAIINEFLYPYIKKLDYILGSVHLLFNKNGIFAFDDRRFIKNYEEYDSIDEIYLDFYGSIQKMIKTKAFDFDIVTHIDLPKKFNKRPEDKELVMENVIKTLELIKKRDLVIEINTSGLRRDIQEQYPSLEIIEKIYEHNIPILLGSDSHHPKEVAYEFNSILNLLKKVGFSKLAHFNNRQRKMIEII